MTCLLSFTARLLVPTLCKQQPRGFNTTNYRIFYTNTSVGILTYSKPFLAIILKYVFRIRFPVNKPYDYNNNLNF